MINYFHNFRLIIFVISWFCAFISIINKQNVIVDFGIICFAIFLLLNLFFLSKQSYFIIFVLFVTSLFLFEEIPSLIEVYEAGRFVIIFAGLIPTMNLVKSAALQLDPIKETQKLLSSLSGENSKAGFQITAHLSGSIMNTGVFPMLAASVPKNSNLIFRKEIAEASIRGMASSVVWSPFFVAFAVGQIYIDNYNSWLSLLIGLLIGSIFTLISVFALNKNLNFILLKRSLNCLRPIFKFLIIVMGIIVSFSLYFNLTALSAVIFVMPILILIYFIKNLKKTTKHIFFDG